MRPAAVRMRQLATLRRCSAQDQRGGVEPVGRGGQWRLQAGVAGQAGLEALHAAGERASARGAARARRRAGRLQGVREGEALGGDISPALPPRLAHQASPSAHTLAAGACLPCVAGRLKALACLVRRSRASHACAHPHVRCCRAHWGCRPVQQELAQLLRLRAPAAQAQLAHSRHPHGPAPPCKAPGSVQVCATARGSCAAPL